MFKHTTKVIEKVFEEKTPKTIKIYEIQTGFTLRNVTMDAIFAMRQLQEKYKKK